MSTPLSAALKRRRVAEAKEGEYVNTYARANLLRAEYVEAAEAKDGVIVCEGKPTGGCCSRHNVAVLPDLLGSQDPFRPGSIEVRVNGRHPELDDRTSHDEK